MVNRFHFVLLSFLFLTATQVQAGVGSCEDGVRDPVPTANVSSPVEAFDASPSLRELLQELGGSGLGAFNSVTIEPVSPYRSGPTYHVAEGGPASPPFLARILLPESGDSWWRPHPILKIEPQTSGELSLRVLVTPNDSVPGGEDLDTFVRWDLEDQKRDAIARRLLNGDFQDLLRSDRHVGTNVTVVLPVNGAATEFMAQKRSGRTRSLRVTDASHEAIWSALGIPEAAENVRRELGLRDIQVDRRGLGWSSGTTEVSLNYPLTISVPEGTDRLRVQLALYRQLHAIWATRYPRQLGFNPENPADIQTLQTISAARSAPATPSALQGFLGPLLARVGLWGERGRELFATSDAVSHERPEIADQHFILNTWLGPVRVKGEDERTPSCFVAGTRVLTPEGAVCIENIQAGQAVWAWDEARGVRVAARVRAVKPVVSQRPFRVTLSDGTVFQVTAEHPFLSAATNTFRPLRDFRKGHALVVYRQNQSFPLEISEIEPVNQEVPVYNFEVNDHNTYMIEGGVIVHNVKVTM